MRASLALGRARREIPGAGSCPRRELPKPRSRSSPALWPGRAAKGLALPAKRRSWGRKHFYPAMGLQRESVPWLAEGMPRSLTVKGNPLTESRGEASGARRVQRGRRTAVSLAPGGGALTGRHNKIPPAKPARNDESRLRHNPSPNDGCRPPALTTPNGENSSLNVSCPYLDATPNQVRVTSRYRRPRRTRRFPLRPVCFGGIFRPVPTPKIQDHFQSPR